MKRLLLILILTFGFQSLTKADDISDFEIEGISIGDSLLDLFTKKEIVSKLINLFNKKSDTYEKDYSGDKSGKSKTFITDIYLDKKGEARVICYDISEKLTKEKGWWDRLSVIINDGEFSIFLSEKAYK